MKKHVKGIGSALLSLAFVFGVLTVAGNTAHAQYRDYGRYERDRDRYEREREWRRQQQREAWRRNNGRYGTYGTYGGYDNYGYQAELNRGYQQGLNTGSSDARRGQSYSPQRSHFYRDRGYSQAFRQGFVRGYDRGYRQYAGYYDNRRYGNNTWGNILGGILRP